MLELANKTVNIFNSKIYYEITEDTSYAKHVHCTTCVHRKIKYICQTNEASKL